MQPNRPSDMANLGKFLVSYLSWRFPLLARMCRDRGFAALVVVFSITAFLSQPLTVSWILLRSRLGLAFLALGLLALVGLPRPPAPSLHFFSGVFSLVFPLVTFAVTFLNARKLGSLGVVFLSSFSLFFSSVFSFFSIFVLTGAGQPFYVVFGRWFSCSLFEIPWSFSFDPLSLPMLFVVSTVSFLVHIYSYEYMGGDRNFISFMVFLFFFTVSMLFLVCSGNLAVFFLGWEFIGLRSFLLVGFWTTRSRASSAALKAVFINRVGDFFLLILVSTLLFSFGSVEFHLLPIFVDCNQDKLLTLAFLAAAAKSAQLGLHVWLPDAMEGPTPVSALIHAATLVTAGLFLLYRFSFLLPYSTFVPLLVSSVGRFTAFFSATVACAQSDVKKVIAYSTCSQLGFMFYAWGTFHPDLSFFHMSTHAFFKASLFLSAGSIIHAFGGEQDMRRMGGCLFRLPLTFSAVSVSSLSLVGFPFTSGFFSKDQILESRFFSPHSVFFELLIFSATFLTAFYSAKLIYFVFFGSKSPRIVRTLESGFFMSLPLFILSIFSLAFGYFFGSLVTAPGTFYWGSFLSLPNQPYSGPVDFHFVPFFLKIFPLFATFGGVLFGVVFFKFLYFSFFSLSFSLFFLFFVRFFTSKWGFDVLYNKSLIHFFMPSSKVYLDNIDRGVLEHLFVTLPFRNSARFFSLSSSFASGVFFSPQPASIVLGFLVLLYGIVFGPWVYYSLIFFLFLFYFQQQLKKN